MTELRQIAVLRGDVVALFRTRADELELSRQTIDRLCGWKSGQAAKYLADPPMRGFSEESMITMAAALGCAIVLAADPQALQEVLKRGVKRQRNAVRAKRSPSIIKNHATRRIIRYMGAAGGKNCSARHPLMMAKIGRKGGHARARALNRKARSLIASNAAIVRWDRVKAAAASSTIIR